MREVGFLEEKFAILWGNDCFLKQKSLQESANPALGRGCQLETEGEKLFLKKRQKKKKGKLFSPPPPGLSLKGGGRVLRDEFSAEKIYIRQKQACIFLTRKIREMEAGACEKSRCKKKSARPENRRLSSPPPVSQNILKSNDEPSHACKQRYIRPDQGAEFAKTRKKCEKVLEKQA